MNLKTISVLLIVFVSLLVPAVSSAKCSGHKKNKGRVLGALIGAVVLNQVSRGDERATVAGALIGGIAGGEVACEMPREDAREAEATLNFALSSSYSNDPFIWRGDNYRGQIVFVDQAWFGRNYRYCREYRHETWGIHGYHMVRRGWYCQVNGRWRPHVRSAVPGGRRFNHKPNGELALRSNRRHFQ